MDDKAFMQMAVSEARMSKAEPNRISPKVGAVLVNADGVFVGKSHRGEDGQHGDHAEFRLLQVKHEHDILAGSTLFTTLEPCFSRRHPKKPCVNHIMERQIKRVVIGMLDPDPTVHGKSQMELLRVGIQIDNFSPEFTKQILEMNRDFIEDRSTPGMKITYPLDGREVLKGKIIVTGTYRQKNSSRERMVLLTRREKKYWPNLAFVADQDGTWHCPIHENAIGETTVIVATIDENCQLWFDHYRAVTSQLTDPKRWVPLEIDRLPSGVKVNDKIKINIV